MIDGNRSVRLASERGDAPGIWFFGMRVASPSDLPLIGALLGLVHCRFLQIPASGEGSGGLLRFSTMGTLNVLLDLPGFDHLLCLREGFNPVLIQALRSEVPVERLDVRDFQLDAVPVYPRVEGQFNEPFHPIKPVTTCLSPLNLDGHLDSHPITCSN